MTPFDDNSELEIWFPHLAGDADQDYGNSLAAGGKKIIEKLAASDALFHQTAVERARERIERLPEFSCYRVVFARASIHMASRRNACN